MKWLCLFVKHLGPASCHNAGETFLVSLHIEVPTQQNLPACLLVCKARLTPLASWKDAF